MSIDTSKLNRYKPDYVHSNDGPGYISMLAREDGEYVRLEDVIAITIALEQALTQQRGELPSAKTFASAVWCDWMTNEQADKLLDRCVKTVPCYSNWITLAERVAGPNCTYEESHGKYKLSTGSRRFRMGHHPIR